jgi:arylsulfatase A-like enzyme
VRPARQRPARLHLAFRICLHAPAEHTGTPRTRAAADWGSYDVAWREKELGRTPQLKTPVLDDLVQQGVKLDDYYVQHICTPTRQALMSGRYQIHTGLQHGIIQNSQKSCLPPKFGTMADAFKSAAFSTHMIGKWCAFPKPGCRFLSASPLAPARSLFADGETRGPAVFRSHQAFGPVQGRVLALEAWL